MSIFDSMPRPRSLALAVIKPREAVRITIDPPLSSTENFLVLTLMPGVQHAIAIDERAVDHTIIRNTREDVEIPYIFVVLPTSYITVLKADWTSLALFLQSLRAFLPGLTSVLSPKPSA